MSDDRPDQGEPREPDQDREPEQGPDLEARRASAPDGAFPGLRSASDIFGAPRRPEDWPTTRRERREAERVAGATDEVAPVPPARPADDDDATQAVSMPEELARPSLGVPESVGPVDLGSRIPPPAAVPPSTTAPHPRSIHLPSAQSSRAERAVEAQEIDEERRRVDPRGTGRDDVDWLGRATGPGPRVDQDTTPDPAAPAGDTAPSSEEPPSFTDLLGLPGAQRTDDETWSTVGRPFDWAAPDSGPIVVPGRAEEPSDGAEELFDGAEELSDGTEERGGADARGETDAHDEPEAASAADTGAPTQAWSLADLQEAERGGSDEPDVGTGADTDAPTAAVPWWAEPEASPPPTAAPPLVDPQPAAASQYPAGQLPPAVGQDLDALLGIRSDRDPTGQHPAVAPTGDELDQTEWADRETSDTGVIHDLFGTGAMQQLDDPEPGPEHSDTGTRMMPAVSTGGASGTPAARTTGGGAPRGADGRDNFINEGFARLQGEGRRGKQLLVVGAVVLIVVLLVAVFLLTRWILGGDPQEQTGASSSPAAASSQQASTAASASPEAAATPTTPVIGFATEPAAAGQHSWRELAGGECLSPFTDAWADTVTVVDCAAPHQGQLTLRQAIDGDAYPGADALRQQVTATCQTAAAIDLARAGAYPDIQVQGTYPPDQAAWDQGDRSSSCFVSRSSGEAITGSLAPTA